MKQLQKIQLQKLDKRWILVLLCGFSETYILFFFEAYNIQTGLSYSGHSHLFRTISFGLLTSLHFYLFDFHLRKLLNLKSLFQKISWYLTLVFIGAFWTFLLFNYFWNWTEWSWIAFYLILKEYPLMLIIPFSIYGILMIKTSRPQTEKIEYLKFISENKKEHFKIDPKDFYYIESADNYVTIYYTSQKIFKKHLIRNTLKRIEEDFIHSPFIKRCHRSYLVNTSKIKSTYQKSGKLRLDLEHTELVVSEKYKSYFM